MNTRIHPETGAVLTRGVRPQVVRYGMLAKIVDTPGWYPEDDGDGLHDMNDLDESDAAFVALRTAYIEHLKEFRERLDLTQEAASELIGGGPRAFQKYESGRAQPTAAAAKLIEVMWEQPEVLATLRKVIERAEPVAAYA